MTDAQRRLIATNPVVAAMRRAARLTAADVNQQTAMLHVALEGLLRVDRDAPVHWASLADAANVAETLEGMGLGAGAEARTVIEMAQEALAWWHQERQERGTWALRADERLEVADRLSALCALHTIQLRHCSYGEFERAYQRTLERLRQARGGNAPKGAIVIEGQLS